MNVKESFHWSHQWMWQLPILKSNQVIVATSSSPTGEQQAYLIKTTINIPNRLNRKK